MIKRGNGSMTIQQGWTVEEDEHGLLTGEVVWEGDYAFQYGAPATGSLHPYDSRLTAYRRRLTRLGLYKCRVSLSFIGVSADPTPMFIDTPGGSGQEPIETHPDFAKFAGTPESPVNGAKFDEETGEFLGFLDPSENQGFRGVTAYIVPNLLLNLSYYTHRVPEMRRVGRIYSSDIPDLLKPPNVKDFLLVGMPYRKIGNLFQVSLQVLGSGPRGWNKQIYD